MLFPEHVSSVTLDRSGQTGVTSAGERLRLPADGVFFTLGETTLAETTLDGTAPREMVLREMVLREMVLREMVLREIVLRDSAETKAGLRSDGSSDGPNCEICGKLAESTGFAP